MIEMLARWGFWPDGWFDFKVQLTEEDFGELRRPSYLKPVLVQIFCFPHNPEMPN